MRRIKAKSARTEDASSASAGLPIVTVWYNGHSIGLYRVKQVDGRAMVLRHGAISFPVGTLLDVVDFQHLLPLPAISRLNATVVDNNQNGIRLAW